MTRQVMALVTATALGLAGDAFAQDLPENFDSGFGFEDAPARLSFGVDLDRSGELVWDGIRTVDDDLLGIARIPLDYPAAFGAAALGIGALILVDVPVTQAYQDTVETALSGFVLPDLNLPWSDPIEDLGFVYEDVYIMTGIAGAYVYGVATGNEQHQQAGILGTKALAYSVLTTQVVLKTLFGRNRPYDDLANAVETDGPQTVDPFDFGNSDGIKIQPTLEGTAFPSYHFTQYAAVAHTLSGVYDDAVWPYVAMGVVAASRIEGHNHWVSDMVAGTLLGIGIGEVVLRNADALRLGEFDAVPSVSQNGIGLTLSRQF
jgi:hypothetical protein